MHTRYYKVISRAAATPQPLFLLAVGPGFVCGSWICMWILDLYVDPGPRSRILGRPRPAAAGHSRPQSLLIIDNIILV